MTAHTLPEARTQTRTTSVTNVFSSGRGVTSFPIELQQGEVIVPVSIGSSRRLRFVLDTGSTRTLIDRRVAQSLGLHEGDASSLQGAGAGRVPIKALPSLDLRLPGLTTRAYQCSTIDLQPVSAAAGVSEDGILGYEFFARFAVTIDFEAKRLTVEDPAQYQPARGFERIPIQIRGKWAYVEGQLRFPETPLLTDAFLLDTGSSDAVDHPIVRTLKDKKVTRSGVGLGSPVEGALAAATSFQLGSFVMHGPIVACCGATDATSRLIGTEVLRRFTVTFDYPAGRMFLRSNRAINEPFGSL